MMVLNREVLVALQVYITPNVVEGTAVYLVASAAEHRLSFRSV
jgi:hypothetical protein